MASPQPVDECSHSEADTVVTVTIATNDDDAYPIGWRYALHYGTVDGEPIRRYDNAHEDTKGHEKRTGYAEKTPGTTSKRTISRE